MYEITIEEIMDYSKCPMYYLFKHKNCMSNEKIDMLDKYEQDLKKVVYYAFVKIQEGEFIRIEDIKQMWGRLWVRDKRKTDLVFSDSVLHKDTYNLKRIKGLESLLSFRDYLIDNNGYPIAINQEYRIKIDDFILKGTFEIVREIEKDGEKQIQLCLFKADKSISRLTNRYDLKLHSDSLAIEKMLDQDIKLDKMVYYFGKGNNSVAIKSEIERKLFLHNIRTIVSLIRQNVFHMNVNENCNSCIYKDICGSKTNTSVLLDKGV